MIDYMVTEAIAIKVKMEDREAEENQTKKDWKKDTDHLKQYQ